MTLRRLANEVMWSELAFEQQAELLKSQPKVFKKLKDTIKSIKRDPDTFLKIAEPLRYDLSGSYSLRLTKKDRLVFRIKEVDDQEILEILECMSHYNDK